MHIELEYRRGQAGRPEGTVRVATDAPPVPFAGTIDLLRLLEELVDDEGLTE